MKDFLAQCDKLKIEIDKFRPLKNEILSQLKEYYKIGLTYSSNALEGNSLTESETKIVIENGITIGGKPLRDHYEAIGHSEAYDLLLKLGQGNGILENDVKELHRLFYFRIDPENAGKYRNVKIIITGTDYIPPEPNKLSGLMKDFINKLPVLKTRCHPLEFASLIHKDLVMIHPFIDGNGRTARLLMNLALMQAGYVIAIIPPILRSEYTAALLKANKGEERPFTNFIIQRVYESLKEYLRFLEKLT